MAEFIRVAALFALTRWDIVGAAVALTGMAIIALQPDANN
jgi:small multidrug resistance family-3 protein